MDNEEIGTSTEELIKSFEFLLLQLEAWKPNDRSKRDRYFAITITEVEKSLAIFKTYAAGE